MALAANFYERLAKLSLHSRLWAVIVCLALPMLVAALLAAGAHLFAASAWQAFAGQEQEAAQLALKANVSLPAVADPATRKDALAALRAQMRDISSVSGETAVRRAAQAVTKLTYDHENPRLDAPAPLAPLLERVVARTGEAAMRAQARAETLGTMALAAMFLLPALATAVGIVLARGLTHSIDGTLRDCITFAGEIATLNFSHGSSKARPAARARHIDADADSASEFDILVRSMNRIADETSIAAKRDAEQALRLERVERALALTTACGQSLLKAPNEAELLTALCGHLIQQAGYPAAWVGYARQDAAHSVDVAAHAGSDADHVWKLQLSWGEDPNHQGGFGTAIHTGEVVKTGQLNADRTFNCGGKLPAPHGLAAAIALPLREGGERAAYTGSDGDPDAETGADADTASDSATIAKAPPFGVLGIYSENADAFDDEEELRLLRELADDLAFGILLHRAQGRGGAVAPGQPHPHPVNYDDLTGLAKLETLERQLAPLADQAQAAQKKLGALHLNLDSFDVINEKLGYTVGDQILVQAALRMAQAAGDGAVLARLDADEFVILLPGLVAVAQAGVVAGRIAAKLAEALASDLLPPDTPLLKLSASIGISVYPDDSAQAGDLLANAAKAMQEAKNQGGNTYRYVAGDLNARIASRAVMEAELGKALERGELLMHYQPQCSLQTGAIVGGEALMRWQHPKKGMLAPLEFIRMAEDTGLVLPIGAWAVDAVCAQLKAWTVQGLQMPAMAVNLSPRQFQRKDLVQAVRRALETHGVPGKALEIEITESALMLDVEAATRTLHELHALGVRITLDDFGTGYSSLSHLKNFPIQRLKIDQSFVHGIGKTPDASDICDAVISLAHTLKVTVVAESVETEEQAAYLRQRRCDAMQGFLFSKAVTPEVYAQLVASGKTMALPATAAPKAAATANATATAAAVAVAASADAQRTLLLLDDEPNHVRALNKVLRGDGYKILAATSAADALKLLSQNPVQVVVSDQGMPEMSGAEFQRQVRQLYPDTVRIVLSGYGELEPVVDAINNGDVHRFFPKPWNDDALRVCVRQAFGQQGLDLQAKAQQAAGQPATA